MGMQAGMEVAAMETEVAAMETEVEMETVTAMQTRAATRST